ncbi:MAG: hypothetical protein JJD97_03250 [Gemmatimonadaceae bacterium]|nr:hypothetical protein [Gemmatimonadaceae bacterium]
MRTIFRALTLAPMIASAMLAGCAKRDAPASGAADSVQSSSATSASSPSSQPPTDITPVRGTLAMVSDSAITVSTAKGDVRVMLKQPVHVYMRETLDLSKVTEHSFVGVTSVEEPDGTQRATEIHVFPEELRGTGEGSYLMTQPGSGDSSARPTGKAAAPRMTNGTVATSPSTTAPRMTNGTVAGQGASTLTVQYCGGSQTIAIPKGVSVTGLVAANTTLTVGAKVVVIAKKQGDGTLASSGVLLAGAPAGQK